MITVRWEAKKVLSQMNYRMSKSSLPVQVLPGLWRDLIHLPFCLNLQYDLCDYFTGLCLKLALPLDHLCLLSKPCSLGLHVLDETKAETDTVVLLEWCSKPEMRLPCFVVASVSGGCGDGGKQIWEEKTKGGKHKRLILWCTRQAWGGGVAGRGLQMQLFCALICTSGSSPSRESALWELAQSFNDGRRGGTASCLSGALCL